MSNQELEEHTLEEVDREECLRLLASQSVGRLAVARPSEAPHVVPVNYVLLRDSILFRSGRGTKLELLVTEPVSFEVDWIDPFHRGGWSVLVRGKAYRASDWEIEVEDLHLESFVPEGKDFWVRLVPEAITGRRIHLPIPSPTDPRGYL
jgi:nitroimidazol reductase NimA-like FMN-containing flavoprotein (pyridoxamine 5'-phosphate oxidase superfamily)